MNAQVLPPLVDLYIPPRLIPMLNDVLFPVDAYIVLLLVSDVSNIILVIVVWVISLTIYHSMLFD